MKNFLRRRVDYTTRLHLRRRAQRIDLRFLIAAVALAAAVAAALRYL